MTNGESIELLTWNWVDRKQTPHHISCVFVSSNQRFLVLKTINGFVSFLAANRLMDFVVTQQLRARERSGAGVEEFSLLLGSVWNSRRNGRGKERKIMRKNLRSSEKKIENARNKLKKHYYQFLVRMN